MRYLILAFVLLVAGCDSPTGVTIFNGKRVVTSTHGSRFGEDRMVWLLGSGSPPDFYVCQVRRSVYQDPPLQAEYECEWRLLDRPPSQMEWDESLTSRRDF